MRSTLVKLSRARTWSLALAFAICSALPGASSDQAEQDAAAPVEPVFRPPEIGTPSGLQGAGTRGAGRAKGRLVSLVVPDGGGTTSSGTPPLLWYLPDGYQGDVRLRVSGRDGGVVAWQATGPFRSGFYALDLKRSGMKLRKDAVYEWTLQLVEGATVVATVASYVMRTGADADTVQGGGNWFDALEDAVAVGLNSRIRILDQPRFSQLLEIAGVDANDP